MCVCVCVNIRKHESLGNLYSKGIANWSWISINKE